MKLQLTTKVQNIYFQDDEGNLGIFPMKYHKRLSLSKAEDVLNDHGIYFRIVFKVLTETETIELTQDEFLHYKIDKDEE